MAVRCRIFRERRKRGHQSPQPKNAPKPPAQEAGPLARFLPIAIINWAATRLRDAEHQARPPPRLLQHAAAQHHVLDVQVAVEHHGVAHVPRGNGAALPFQA